MSPAVVSVATLALAIGLLASNRVRFDVVAVIVLAILGVTGVVGPSALFVGFSSTPTVVIAAMLVLGGGLRHTGAIDVLSRGLLRVARRWPQAYRPVMLATAALPSAFVSDVGLMGIMLPTVMSMRRRLRLSAPEILMPLAISIALGGLLSMVGSAGNIIANGDLGAAHRAPLALFAITPLGIVVVMAGIGAVLVTGRWLLPHGGADGDDGDGAGAQLLDLDCVAELDAAALTTDDRRPGRAEMEELVSGHGEREVRLLGIAQPDGSVDQPGHAARVRSGASLLVRARAGELLDSGLLVTDQDAGPAEPAPEANGHELDVVEVLVPPGSPLAGHRLGEAALERRFGMQPVALAWRRGMGLAPLRDVRLREGDVILVTATERGIHVERRELLVLAHLEHHLRPVTWRTIVSSVIVAAALVLVALSLLPLTVALATGAVALVVTGCLPLDDAYRAIDWRLVFLLGGFIPLGDVLSSSGVIGHVGRFVASSAGPAGPEVIMGVFFVLAALLTQVLSNAATALVLSPLALSVAGSEHLSPVPLLVAVMVAVSASPLTPLANKVYLMTTGPGHYRYRDFIRLGLVVTAASGAVTLLLGPLLFPFHP